MTACKFGCGAASLPFTDWIESFSLPKNLLQLSETWSPDGLCSKVQVEKSKPVFGSSFDCSKFNDFPVLLVLSSSPFEICPADAV